MKNLKGTKTAENLLKAFAGESQARNRYTFYASVANTEGLIQMENFFIETANNEKEHAQRFYNLLLDGFKGELPVFLEITADFPIAKGTTLDNLNAAIHGEHEENSVLYPSFEKIAENEGFLEVASAFKHIAHVEKRHEERFKKLADNIAQNAVFSRTGTYFWKCENCGYVHESGTAPTTCPSCLYPQSYFEIFVENY